LHNWHSAINKVLNFSSWGAIINHAIDTVAQKKMHKFIARTRTLSFGTRFENVEAALYGRACCIHAKDVRKCQLPPVLATVYIRGLPAVSTRSSSHHILLRSTAHRNAQKGKYMAFSIVRRFQSIVEYRLQKIGAIIARWTKPRSPAPALGIIGDLVRSKPQLVAENLLLRQQLLVLHRRVKRPRLTLIDRALLVLLASRVDTWKEALLIVKPETVLR